MLHEFAHSSPRSTEGWISGDRTAARKSARYLSTEALTKQIGHFDEESSSVAAEARLELIGKRTEAVAIEIVVVSDIESRPRIRRPAKEELPFDV